eukprot:CAMPEP_0172549580 /NCGR_PEP_ID=MMETSP1067-20121228/18609_1 /TAXON_ID=265564 ORGANISM="Thalassiosira punctigera, Strain Tpunct2005C2" /NCGR_SAMPLE_ID=MMETSP1067 /ASSEMBLY_ACC=CAM_ASM_000444 /LENGTH=245 /DNA_ID=CAMNT_0013336975 /DNA_START=229 /DNA_END=963 /DNA_ORIENTATION=+
MSGFPISLEKPPRHEGDVVPQRGEYRPRDDHLRKDELPFVARERVFDAVIHARVGHARPDAADERIDHEPGVVHSKRPQQRRPRRLAIATPFLLVAGRRRLPVSQELRPPVAHHVDQGPGQHVPPEPRATTIEVDALREQGEGGDEEARPEDRPLPAEEPPSRLRVVVGAVSGAATRRRAAVVRPPARFLILAPLRVPRAAPACAVAVVVAVAIDAIAVDAIDGQRRSQQRVDEIVVNVVTHARW